MNNIMELAQEYAVSYRVNRAVDEARAALEAAVNEQAAEIERLTLRLKMTSDTMNGYMLERDALQAKLSAMEKQEPQPPFGSKRKAAMAVYKPPFKYEHGYVYDSQNMMVADDGDIANEKLSVTGAVASRVRGWGRLSYLPNGAELQDEIGQMMADALGALYTAPKAAQPPEALEALFTNIDHAISSGAWKGQEGSQTWETIHEAKSAIGGQQP